MPTMWPVRGQPGSPFQASGTWRSRAVAQGTLPRWAGVRLPARLRSRSGGTPRPLPKDAASGACVREEVPGLRRQDQYAAGHWVAADEAGARDGASSL